MTPRSSTVELPFRLRQPVASGENRVGGIVRQGKQSELVTISLDGRVSSKLDLPDDCRFPIGVNESTIWLAFENRLEQRTLDGDLISELEFEFGSPRRRIGAAIFYNDDIIAAIERMEPGDEHGLSGELFRMRKDGDLVWGSVLKVERIGYCGCVEATAENGFQNLPKPAWKPKQWVTDLQAPILVSGDQVYASWQESLRSGIGKYYAVRLSDGHPVTATKPYPVSWTCNLRDGRILIAAGGYGACWTVRIDPTARKTGQPELAWPTQGRFFRSIEGELYCVEMLHGSRKAAHVVRLLPDRTTTQIGGSLTGYHTSRPIGIGDGRFCFWRGGSVRVCDPGADSLEEVASTGNAELDDAESIQLGQDKVAIFVHRNAKGSAPAKCQLILLQSNQVE